MLSVRKSSPVRYDKCTQTVTVYHKDGDTITRTVHPRAFLDFRKTRNVDKTGAHDANSFLLVIPGDTQAVFVGDKVMMGAGPADILWPSFIPAKVQGLVVVRYADPKYFGGQLVHTEAGG